MSNALVSKFSPFKGALLVNVGLFKYYVQCQSKPPSPHSFRARGRAVPMLFIWVPRHGKIGRPSLHKSPHPDESTPLQSWTRSYGLNQFH